MMLFSFLNDWHDALKDAYSVRDAETIFDNVMNLLNSGDSMLDQITLDSIQYEITRANENIDIYNRLLNNDMEFETDENMKARSRCWWNEKIRTTKRIIPITENLYSELKRVMNT